LWQLLRSERCGLVLYCGRDSQKAHWKANHKRHCVANADRAVQRQQEEPLDVQRDPASSTVGVDEKCAICLDYINGELVCTLPCTLSCISWRVRSGAAEVWSEGSVPFVPHPTATRTQKACRRRHPPLHDDRSNGRARKCLVVVSSSLSSAGTRFGSCRLASCG